MPAVEAHPGARTDAGLRDEADRLRTLVLETHQRAGAGHLGSALSIVEILAVVLGRFFRWRGDGEPAWAGDRFVLSKGHGALGLYAALARAGRIPPERLAEFGSNGAVLEPHPNEAAEPELHASTGSLGQGISIGVGLALGSRLRGAADRTWVVIGDGEANEGQVWEAARSAAALNLSHLVVVLDDNGMQQDGPTGGILPVDDLAGAWAAMGWRTAEADGHDCDALIRAIEELLALPDPAPRLLRARTVKGRGVEYLEGRTESHYPPPLSAEDLALARYLAQTRRAHG
ncbi:MAG TPA: transketolase [Longimicrobium sp.]|nr:transketolase [Longimicrobium sp.]